MDNPYKTRRYTITDKRKFTEDTILFRLACGLDPAPGQFVEVSVHGIGECPISVSSCSSSYIDLLIRDMGNVTSKLVALEKGDTMDIRGPYGKGYPVADFESKNIVIIAGGTGVAPPRSVIEHIIRKRKRFGQVHIFLGFREPKEILFHKDIERWQSMFDVIFTVDKCADPNYQGKVCFVTDAFSEAQIPPEDAVAVLCGPPVMMKVACGKLQEKGYKDEQMYLSFERHMKCGIGKCGHCVIAGKYVCKDGPVFNYTVARGFYD